MTGFNTQPPEGGWRVVELTAENTDVSTHSRPKAAGCVQRVCRDFIAVFQHTAARRRLAYEFLHTLSAPKFQHTAARRRLDQTVALLQFQSRRFNTQPPEGGWAIACSPIRAFVVSTHSRPKAAGTVTPTSAVPSEKFQHTAARRRLEAVIAGKIIQKAFQHTAARRRLGICPSGAPLMV